MKIKKLELIGFKSFVDKTVVQFDHDVIGIVGPNGCGKSNIVDAIRWCMGEQSAKNLRGRSMDDVIFSGSESRSGNEFAEVTLTFENDRGDVPIEYKDYPEIAVTRRLNRAGDSDYFINRTPVRLKDITDLFLGTGVGTKAYSIIEQGKVGLIVSAKPEDRRLLIEEAAGITKYKARKKQAERKMELTQQNLLRVGDIVSEIERNLGSLKRQAAKAERFISYRSELEDLLLYEASHKYLEHRAWVGYETELVLESEAIADKTRSDLTAREADLEAVRLQATEVEERLNTVQAEHFAAENAVRAEEAAILRMRDRLDQIRSREGQAVSERETLDDERQTLTLELTGLEEAARNLAEEEGSRAERVHESEAREAECFETQRSAVTTHGSLVEISTKARTEIAAAEAKLSGFDRRREEMETRLGRFRIEHENVSLDRAEAEGRSRQLDREIENLRTGKVTSVEERTRQEVRLVDLKRDIGESERALDEVKHEVTKKRSRLHALLELQSRLEGIGQGVKALLGKNHPGCKTLVADTFEVSESGSLAVAALLGTRIQEVVADDLDEGILLLGELASGKKGRATLSPAHPKFVAGALAPLPEIDGVLGYLVDHVTFEPEREALVRNLFGASLLVRDAEVARSLLAPSSADLAFAGAKIVTEGGTVFHEDGRVSGGSGDDFAQGVLDSKRETRELTEEVDRLDTILSERLAHHQILRSSIAEVQSALDHARQQAHADELSLVTAEKDHRAAVAAHESASRRIEKLDSEIQETSHLLEEAASERDTALALVDEARATLEAAAESLLEAEIARNEAERLLTDARKELTEKRIVHASAKEKLTAAENAALRLRRSIDELAQRGERLSDELSTLAEHYGTSAGELMLHRATLHEALDQAKIESEKLAAARSDYEGVKGDLSARDAALRDLRHAAEAAKDELAQHEMSLREHEIALAHVIEGVRERFRGLMLPRVVGDYHLRPAPGEEVRTRASELQVLLDRMGSVNLEAMREHEEAETRYQFYSTQKADLDKALADLERAIQQMNRESRRLFAETFDAVNQRFQEVFPRMFRGGRASLRLTNPEDMLETGIDILAQPPGKKLSSIELMSGGEKALTAVSLIFAIFQIKPSPFCILDEVDAPLDEANVTRYNDMVRSMTDRSQFILITHIKRTMQSVDMLYGVTMQESGVSRLVGVKISETGEAKKPKADDAPKVDDVAVA